MIRLLRRSRISSTEITATKKARLEPRSPGRLLWAIFSVAGRVRPLDLDGRRRPGHERDTGRHAIDLHVDGHPPRQADPGIDDVDRGQAACAGHGERHLDTVVLPASARPFGAPSVAITISKVAEVFIILAVTLAPSARRRLGRSVGQGAVRRRDDYFVAILAPQNQPNYDLGQFLNSALPVVVGTFVAAIFSRLIPPVSPAWRTRRRSRCETCNGSHRGVDGLIGPTGPASYRGGSRPQRMKQRPSNWRNS